MVTHPAWAVPATERSAQVTREQHSGPDTVHATAMLPIGTTALLSVLENPCHVRRWMPDLEELEVLTQHDGHSLVYMRTRAPWPLRPRDAVTRFTRHITEDGIVTLTMRGESDAVAPVPGVVRMPFIDGQWQLTPAQSAPASAPEGGTLTRVDYAQRVSPGGGVPQWLADQTAVRHVRATLAALEEYLEEYVEQRPEDNDCQTAELPGADDGSTGYQPGRDA